MTTPSAPPADASASRAKERRSLLALILKVGVIALVLWAFGQHLWALSREWSQQGRTFSSLELSGSWLTVATVAFLGSQLCFCQFWGRLLKRCGVAASWVETLTAYCLGTLGKYVPGKALVVLIRTGLLPECHISRLSIGLTVVYETLTMMAVGSAVASVCLLIVQPGQWFFWLGAAAAGCALTAGMHPALFTRLAALAALPFKESGDGFPANACWTTFRGWGILSAGGWLLLGTSFWATARAIGIECSTAEDYVLLTGAAAMATAVGFMVLFVPAGLGVRELIIIHLLAPRYGASEVVLATLLLRTIWTSGEVICAGTMWLINVLRAKMNRKTVLE